MGIQVDSKISDYLGRKGKARLEVKNSITRAIFNLDPEMFPGIKLRFLETRYKKEVSGSWVEYNVLLEIRKYQDTSEYLSFILKNLGKLLKSIDNIGIDSIGIQEVECGLPDYYYLLIYILSDGKDKKKENDIFYDYEGED